jgi:hypothetical protein
MLTIEESMTRKFSLSIFVVLLFIFGLVVPVFAQQAEFSLSVRRNFGYSSGSQIRGTFGLDIIGSQAIKSVTYQIDGKLITRLSSAPFNTTIQTADYPEGWHDLVAVVETQDGRTVTTEARRFEFVSASQESSGVINIIGPLLGGIFLLLAIFMGVQMFAFRNKPKLNLPLGEQRSYGFRGGSVCPHCHRAVALHWWSVNIGLGVKFDRCDFCGKWSILKVLSASELRAAEAAELEMAQPAALTSAKSEKDNLEDMLNNSRYINQ